MKKNVLSAISLVAALTLIAKGLGMLRDILQARAFGTTAEVDLFTAANNITIYLFTTAAYALCLAAVPVFAGKLAKSRKETMETANNLISITTFVSVIVTGLMIVLSLCGVLGSGTGESGYTFGWYAAVMSITLPLIVLTYLFMALFQAMGHYSLQGSLSLLYNLVVCIVLLFAGKQMSLPVFALIMSIAWILQFAMVVPYFFKEKYKFSLKFNFRAPELKIYVRTAAVTAFTTTAFLLCYLLDTKQSAHIGAGVTSAFYYADKLFTPVTTTLIYSIGAVIFPKWSELYAKLSDKQYKDYVGNVVENTVVLLLPLSFVFASFGVPIVRVLFEGGSFDAQSSVMTGAIFSKYMLGMIGFALLDLFAKAYYAMGKTKEPLIVNLAVIAFNFILNFVLLKLGFSSSAVALSTVVSLTLGGTALAVLFYKKDIGKIFNYKRLVKSVVISALLYVGLYYATGVFTSFDDSKIMLVVKCGALVVVAAAIYLIFMGKSLLIKNDEKQEVCENE